MQSVPHGVFLFGEVSKDVLAVSPSVLSKERVRGRDGRDGAEIREVDAKSREASGFERWCVFRKSEEAGVAFNSFCFLQEERAAMYDVNNLLNISLSLLFYFKQTKWIA